MFPHFKVSLRDLENKLMVAREKDEGKDRWGAGIVMYALLYFKCITSTGNSAQRYVAAWMGGELGGERIHVCVWLSPFAVHLKLS